MRLGTRDMEIKMRRYVREPEVGDKIIFRYEGWMDRNICAVFASAKFWWLGELIEIGNTGMTYLVQNLLFYYIVPKETFVFLVSSFSKIAPICVHSLFKIISLISMFRLYEPTFQLPCVHFYIKDIYRIFLTLHYITCVRAKSGKV